MTNKKWCWLARETKKGWRLSLEIGNHTMKTPSNLIFKTVKAVESFANSITDADGKIVFIHLRNTKYPVK